MMIELYLGWKKKTIEIHLAKIQSIVEFCLFRKIVSAKLFEK